MGDFIPGAAVWQGEHWSNRSAKLKDDGILRGTAGHQGCAVEFSAAEGTVRTASYRQ